MLKAVNIKWDVTDDDIDEMDDEACEILESLPTEMIIPEGMTDPDEISDWLSDETGYCHDGFRLVDQNGNDADMCIIMARFLLTSNTYCFYIFFLSPIYSGLFFL